ncbi:uncharacterized protein LOC143546922 [Bidens hawaiensis]|uniref:uncharacterized protein LOC143546922 n=1 Tax=Bidens hawaiensis TaxID=980011 RepID=UPI00404A094B
MEHAHVQSALFNFHSFLTVVLLVICTCTFLKMQFPTILEHKTGFRGFFWKAARIGERLSPWVAFGCFTMGVLIIIFLSGISLMLVIDSCNLFFLSFLVLGKICLNLFLEYHHHTYLDESKLG